MSSSEDNLNEEEIRGMAGVENNDEGCPTIPNQETYNPADSLDMLEEAAKAMGMSQECVTEAKAISNDTASSTQANAQLTLPMGGASAQFQDNRSTSYIDNTMTSKGCQPISLVSNQMKLEQTAMTCNMNKTKSTSETTMVTSMSLTIRANPIIDAGVIASIQAGRSELNTILAKSQASVDLFLTEDYPSSELIKITLAANGDQEILDLLLGFIEKTYKAKKDLVTEIHQMNTDAVNNYDYNNPITSSLTGVDINQTIDASITAIHKQEIDAQSTRVMKESMERLSRAVAHEELNSKLGPGANLDNARSMVNKQCEDSFTNQKTNIDNTITENKMTMDTSNNIILDVVGPIRDSDISQAISTQVSLSVQQCVKKSVEIGQTVANKIINETIDETIDNRVAAGVDEVIAASGRSRADFINATKTEPLADVLRAQGGASAQISGAILDGASNVITAGFDGIAGVMTAGMLPFIVIGGVIALVVLYMMFGKSKPPGALSKGIPGNFASMAKAAASGGRSRFGLPIMLLTSMPWKKIFGFILLIVFVLFMIFYGYPRLKKKFEGRVRNNKVNIPAPRQGVPPVNTQSLKNPYPRVENRNFKGDRSARELPSFKKINHYYRSPTEKVHNTSYNVNQASKNISTVNNPSYHFQNKVEDKPVMYSKKSAYKNSL